MLSAFLQRLLSEGIVRFEDRPSSTGDDRNEATQVLETAYADYRLEIAGPLILFDGEVAVASGELVQYACWFLVNHDEPDSALEERLRMPISPSTPAHHLSADLVLRYLPQVHRRARALFPADLLPRLLARILREWPLSGVLSEVEEGPLSPLDFQGHSGLWMRYAERLARHEKPAWFPTGPGMDYVDLIWREMGRQTPQSLLTTPPSADSPLTN
jgi:hypothetical protein